MALEHRTLAVEVWMGPLRFSSVVAACAGFVLASCGDSSKEKASRGSAAGSSGAAGSGMAGGGLSAGDGGRGMAGDSSSDSGSNAGGQGGVSDSLLDIIIPGRGCWPSQPQAMDGQIPCTMFEAQLMATDCGCESAILPDLLVQMRELLATTGFCDGAADVSCADLCFCEFQQFSGSELTSCQNDLDPMPSAAGFCYVDAEQGVGDPALVADCPETMPRMLRVIDPSGTITMGFIPEGGPVLFISCSGT